MTRVGGRRTLEPRATDQHGQLNAQPAGSLPPMSVSALWRDLVARVLVQQIVSDEMQSSLVVRAAYLGERTAELGADLAVFYCGRPLTQNEVTPTC